MNILCLILFIVAVSDCRAEEEDDHISPVPLPLSGDPPYCITRPAPTTIEKYPFVVQILHLKTVYDLNKLVCGGVILTRRYVLSAANCFVHISSCGKYSITNSTTDTTTAHTITHPTTRSHKTNADTTTAETTTVDTTTVETTTVDTTTAETTAVDTTTVDTTTVDTTTVDTTTVDTTTAETTTVDTTTVDTTTAETTTVDTTTVDTTTVDTTTAETTTVDTTTAGTTITNAATTKRRIHIRTSRKFRNRHRNKTTEQEKKNPTGGHSLRGTVKRKSIMQPPPSHEANIERSGLYVDPMKYRVRVGTTRVTVTDARTLHEVATIIIHERYSCVDNDIALVRLWKPVLLSSVVKAVDLPIQGEQLRENAVLTAVGWDYQGKTDSNNMLLHELSVKKVEWSKCNDIYLEKDPRRPITANVICVKPSADGGKGRCSFENGGPLLHKNVLVGVASRQYRAECNEVPHVYTRISSHTIWIQNVIKMSTHRALPMAPLPNSSPINKIGVTMLTLFLYLVLSA